MGRKKIGFKKPSNSRVDSLKSAVSDDEDEEGIEQHQSILEDEIDQYNTIKDNALLDKAKKGKVTSKRRKGKGDDDDEDDEQEVYNLGLTSSEEDDDDEEGESIKRKGFNFDEDVEDIPDDVDLDDSDDSNDEEILGRRDPDDGVPDSRAWGKKAKIYHNTDYVDQDFGGFEGSDAEMAEQEEAEAKEIQKRLTAELDEDDFLGLVPVAKKAEGTNRGKSKKDKEILKVDFDNLSLAEKRKLVERECPEVIHMLDEYKEKLKEARNTKTEMRNVSEDILKRFYQSKFHALLNYCINISYYLYLRSTSPTNCKGHPVIKRILQFRRLLDELSQFNPSKYVSSKPKSKSDSKKSKKEKKESKDVQIEDGKTLGEQEVEFKFGDESDEEGGDGNEQEKRGITYAIAKNKGLTPKRKKEQRNPRVKHREKYRKAQIRRKGQVRTPRTEMQRYGGEVSGIKSYLTKSVKIK